MILRIAEQLQLPSRGELDRENRIARGVLVLRPRMQGGRRLYSDRARQQIVELINSDRPRVYLDHSTTRDRKLADLAGFLDNAVLDSDGAVRADLIYSETAAKRVEDLIVNLGDKAGLSIDAVGISGMTGEGVEVVEEITELISVDFVAHPSHGGGLFESRRDPDREEYLRAAGIEPEDPELAPDAAEYLAAVTGEPEPTSPEDAATIAEYEAAANAPDDLRL